jgi:2'-5' RNA ligase
VDTTGGRSAIVVPFVLPAALEAIRLDHVDNARLGVPAHVTLLFPFVPAFELAAADIERAATVVGAAQAFDVAFREVASFEPGSSEEGAVWLAPEPPEPFVRLIDMLVEAFPAYLPYEGLHETVIPHLTLGNVRVDVPALQAAARPHLPLTRRVEAAALLVEDESGRWRIERELPLG